MTQHLQSRIRHNFLSCIALFPLLLSALASNSFGQLTLFDSSFRVGVGADGGVNSIGIQDDGRILVGGYFHSIAGHPHSHLARLNLDGSYDDSLVTGTDGWVLRFLRQPDGKMLVAGAFTNLQGILRKRVGRLLATGEVDLEFNAGSLLETNYAAITLGLQPDGKILVATVVEGPAARLFRLLPNGSLDASFIQTNVFADYHIFSILVRSNGTILVGGGFGSAGGHNSPGLALLGTDGRPETNFNSGFKNLSTVGSILEQANGKLLIGGAFRRPGETNYTAVARLEENLESDTGFSPDLFQPPPSESVVFARSILEQPDGKLIVAGFFYSVGGYWRQHIARLDAQGRVDPCFDPGLGLGNATLGVVALARQNDGRILAGGHFESMDGYKSGNIARLLPQSDCSMTRIQLGQISDGGYHYVAGTSPPGGELYVQASTNLVHWEDLVGPGTTHLIHYLFPPLKPPLFFRARKVY